MPAVAKLLLLDGNSLAYRAFFALPTDMATMSGQVTNAVFGFTSMLVNLLKDHRPEGIAVAFDRPEPTFRHELVSDYKAGRAEAPDILRQQMGLVRQVVETLRIPVVEVAGFEADDVIATLATQARDRGDDVIIVTGDRDTYQLVEDPHVRVLYNRRGVSDYVLYDEAGIQERTGVMPEKYPEYAALRGDPSDNLPGVPGVGEKTAARLITTYGDIDGVFAHLDEMTPKLRESLSAHEDQVRSNAKATPLVRTVPRSCAAEAGTGLGAEVDPVRAQWLDLELLTDPGVGAALAALVGPGGPPLHAHRAKELMRGLSVLGVEVSTLDLDTAVAAYLVDPAESQYLLEDLAARYAGIELRSPDAPPAGQLDLGGGGSDAAEDAGRRAAAVARLVVPLSAALDARALRPLYDDVERPLVR